MKWTQDKMNRKFEALWVSGDIRESDFQSVFKGKMPWYAIPLKDKALRDSLIASYSRSACGHGTEEGAEVIIIDRKGTNLTGNIAPKIKEGGFNALVEQINLAYDNVRPKVERFQTTNALDEDFQFKQ